MSRKPSIFLNIFQGHIYIDIYRVATRVGLCVCALCLFMAKKTIVRSAAIKKDYVV